jgi:hypothetical protein
MNLPMSVPTDNVYKFAAIFGLVMVIASFWGIITQTSLTNEIVLVSAPEIASLEANQSPTPSEKAKLDMLKKRKEAAIEDRKGISDLCSKMAGLGTAVSLVGFFFWYWMIQRHQDRLLKLQVIEAERKEREAATRNGESTVFKETDG